MLSFPTKQTRITLKSNDVIRSETGASPNFIRKPQPVSLLCNSLGSVGQRADLVSPQTPHFGGEYSRGARESFRKQSKPVRRETMTNDCGDSLFIIHFVHPTAQHDVQMK